MKCLECNKEKKSHFDKLAIKLLNRCVDCKIIWEQKAENDPENNRYDIFYSWSNDDRITIYAKSKEDAEEDFWNNYAEEENTEIDSIREITREEINDKLAEQAKEIEQGKMEQAII